MFGFTKSKLKSYLFEKNLETVHKICEIMFSFTQDRMASFFRKTLTNFIQFWASVDQQSLFMEEENLDE